MSTRQTPARGTGTTGKRVHGPVGVRRSRRIQQTVLTVLLAAGGLLMLVPLIWVALSSLKRPDEILSLPVKWMPEDFFNVGNYVQLFAEHDFGRYMLNSFIVTAIGISTSLIIALLAGYAFAYFTFPFKEPIFLLVLALFMVPQEALVIPLYLMVSGAGLTNTYPAWHSRTSSLCSVSTCCVSLWRASHSATSKPPASTAQAICASSYGLSLPWSLRRSPSS